MRVEGACWHGEPIYARRVRAVVADTDQFPRYWAREEGIIGTEVWVVEAHLPATEREYHATEYVRNSEGKRKRVRVTKHDPVPARIVYFYDEDGSGTRKLVFYKGSPLGGHRNVAVERVIEDQPKENGMTDETGNDQVEGDVNQDEAPVPAPEPSEGGEQGGDEGDGQDAA